MIETIAIIVGVVTGVGAIGGVGYKIYQECHNHPIQQVTITNASSTPPSPVLDRVIKDAIKHHLEDSDSDTEIDIKIHVHHKERDSNGSKESR